MNDLTQHRQIIQTLIKIMICCKRDTKYQPIQDQAFPSPALKTKTLETTSITHNADADVENMDAGAINLSSAFIVCPT